MLNLPFLRNSIALVANVLHSARYQPDDWATQQMTTPVGFVGLGRMGKPIAANILAAGFDLMVFDVREEPMRELAQLGAKPARGLRELGEHAEIIGVAVVNDSQVEEVVMSDAGLLQSDRRDSIS
jgi:2-hydroxy-3-oxopropionate reductase